MPESISLTALAPYGSIGATILAVAILWYRSKQWDMRIVEILERMQKMEVKIDTLWDTYVVDALKSSQNARLIQHGSPLHTNETWERLVTPEKAKQIKKYIEDSIPDMTVYDIVSNTWVAYREDFLKVLEKHPELDTKAIIGALAATADKMGGLHTHDRTSK